MTDLDSLLRASATKEILPRNFMHGIMDRIETINKRKERYALIRNSVFLACMLLLVFYSAYLLLTDLIIAQTTDFISLAWSDPRILAIEEGWLGILESLPIISSLLVILTATITGFALRSFLRASHIIIIHPTRYAH